MSLNYSNPRTDAELDKAERDGRAAKMSSVVSLARQMFELLCASDLTSDQRQAALHVLNIFSKWI